MQTLKSYLTARSKSDFAAKVGIVPAYLSQIMSGFRKPSLDLMRRIQDASDGEVGLNAWDSDNFVTADASAAAPPQSPSAKTDLKCRAAS